MEGFSIAQIFLSLLTLISSAGDIPVSLPDDSLVMNDQFYAAALEGTQIELENGRDDGERDRVSDYYLDHCKALSYKALSVLPANHVEQVAGLTFFYKEGERRGFGTDNRVLMRCQDMSDEEFVAVFVHEVGHIVDLGVMIGDESSEKSEFVDGTLPIYENDESLDFYRISWESSDELLSTMEEVDFVSEYAMTNAFEDFGESYAFYVLQGDEFRKLAETNSTLKLKYVFLRDVVFEGKEFSVGEFEADFLDREYDTTVLPYRLNDLLASKN